MTASIDNATNKTWRTHVAAADIGGKIIHCTPGRRDMRVTRLEVQYDEFGGVLVYLGGRSLREDGHTDNGPTHRITGGEHAPEWAREFVDTNRPAWVPVAAP